MNANAKSAKANLYRATSIDLELPLRTQTEMWTWPSEYLTNYVSSKELARKFRGTCHEIPTSGAFTRYLFKVSCLHRSSQRIANTRRSRPTLREENSYLRKKTHSHTVESFSSCANPSHVKQPDINRFEQFFYPRTLPYPV